MLGIVDTYDRSDSCDCDSSALRQFRSIDSGQAQLGKERTRIKPRSAKHDRHLVEDQRNNRSNGDESGLVLGMGFDSLGSIGG
jgi:hypothetical protein